MVRNSASEIAQHALSGIRIPFFRMSLMRRDLSKQHHLLMRLDRRLPNSVYYATPCIENATVFNLAYNSGQIHQQTVFFRHKILAISPTISNILSPIEPGCGTVGFVRIRERFQLRVLRISKGTRRRNSTNKIIGLWQERPKLYQMQFLHWLLRRCERQQNWFGSESAPEDWRFAVRTFQMNRNKLSKNFLCVVK